MNSDLSKRAVLCVGVWRHLFGQVVYHSETGEKGRVVTILPGSAGDGDRFYYGLEIQCQPSGVEGFREIFPGNTLAWLPDLSDPLTQSSLLCLISEACEDPYAWVGFNRHDNQWEVYADNATLYVHAVADGKAEALVKAMEQLREKLQDATSKKKGRSS